MDTRTEEAGQWIQWEERPQTFDARHNPLDGKPRNITKVLMNPPYENKYGCMAIVENVLNHVPGNTLCGFILPDKKLEKASEAQIRRILRHHRLTKIIKLPEELFAAGVTTSIFVFVTGIPQNGTEIFACYMENDGLETVKNKGRHDVRGRWPAIEEYWVDCVKKLRDDRYGTAQWIKPSEHLSYQMPEKPFEVFKEDFRKSAMDYLLFQQGIDAKDFSASLMNAVMYSSEIQSDDESIRISISAGDRDE